MLLRALCVLVFVINCISLVDCDCDAPRCDWSSWEKWSSCSSTCGGGTQWRSRGLCCRHNQNTHDCLRECKRDSSGFDESRNCALTCYNGGSISNAQPYCRCTPDYGGLCCQLPKCSWRNRYCWPGTCIYDFTTSCICAQGFKRVSTSSETTCQPDTSPTIQTCRTTFRDKNGGKFPSMSSTNSTECKYYGDVYGNSQIVSIAYDTLAEFTLGYSNLNKPKFIKEENFGITDAGIYVRKRPLTGQTIELTKKTPLQDTSSSTGATTPFTNHGNISSTGSKFTLQNGDWLCVTYEAFGGGYLISTDISGSKHVDLPPTPYRKTKASKDICYRYDDKPPMHCSETRSCHSDPLTVHNRVTRSGIVLVEFKNWTDPIPNGGKPDQASKIESYEVRVSEVTPSNKTLQVSTGIVLTQTIKHPIAFMKLDLTSESPKLYCLTLEVKDFALNVKRARRFVLFDNSSYLQIRNDKKLFVASASKASSYEWQTHHHDMCVDWKEYFFNRFYFDNPLLNPIEPDPSGFVIRSSIYEQNKGILPVSGTENVHGIINYQFTWKLNDGNYSHYMNVANITSQRHCQPIKVKDGQTYTFKILATDIVGNTIEDSTSVQIDRSVPHIQNIWLKKGNFTSLFVHDEKELSTMNLYFEALDPHSGIQNVNWVFGTSDSGDELLNGHLSPSKNGSFCSSANSTCYCPDVGSCETFNYTISLNGLVSENKNDGNHNRNYYFTIKATNNALLSNIEHVEILVDDSPPETGAISEGAVGNPDIDYTSDEIIMVNWHGFIDHESGIKLYRLGLARRCLEIEELVEMQQSTDIVEIKEVLYTVTNARFQVNVTGLLFFTILAMNNAMDPSKPVCSDGINRIVFPPKIHNLTILHGSWSESIACESESPWFLQSYLSKIHVDSVSACVNRCRNISTNSLLLKALPKYIPRSEEDEIADFLCQRLPLYNNDIIMYLPDDHIDIQWQQTEDEGQVHDYLVGFGRDPSEVDAPNIIDYESTNRKTYFKRRHEGLGTNTMFYIFLKSLGKSGLSQTLTIGPIVVDVTAPVQIKPIFAETMKDEIKVSWDNDTFYDPEQSSKLGKIMFRFETDDGPVTPLHEWRLKESHACEVCFTYQLHRLQAQDNDLSRSFYAKLFVFNEAGHFLEVTSEPFRLPSRYPPGHAIMYDLDPEYLQIEPLKDIDHHFTANVLCVAWEGFKHHEGIELEIGVGLTKNLDDVLKYSPINNTERECINSSNISTGRQYFVLVKAKCSGGVTYSSTNGVEILSSSYFRDSLKLFAGRNIGDSTPMSMLNVSTGINRNISFAVSLLEEKTYCLSLSSNGIGTNALGNSIIESKDAFIHPVQRNTVPFVPMVAKPIFSIYISNENGSFVTLSVQNCLTNSDFITLAEDISVFWNYTHNTGRLFSHVIKLIKTNNLSNDTQPAEYVTHLYGRSNINMAVRFENIFSHGDKFRAELQLIKNDRVIFTAHSPNITVVKETFDGSVEYSSIKYNSARTCLDVEAFWRNFESESEVIFYSWALSEDVKAFKLLTKWSLVSANGNTTYQVSKCIKIPVYAAKTMFVCVRGYSKAGSVALSCLKVANEEITSVASNMVYDFDTTTNIWKNIKQMIHSQWLGEGIRILHNNELNFGTVESVVGAAMTYVANKNVTWYLTTSPSTPKSCKSNKQCLEEVKTDTGFVFFSKSKTILNTKLYTCIHIDATILQRELYNETFHEIDVCSNGFILDGVAPVAGKIYVESNKGYLNSKRIQISWSGFEDNVNAVDFGYPSNFSYSSIAIGSSPGSSDILPVMNTSNNHVEAIVDIEDGSTLFIQVTAFDRSGQKTSTYSDGLHLDTSRPNEGRLLLTNANLDQLYLSSYVADVLLMDFFDIHSGIDYFEIGVGTNKNIDDIKQMSVHYSDNVKLNIAHDKIVDGHQYFIIVTATNMARLQSDMVSLPFVVDTSPPLIGHILDGPPDLKKDVDFQSQTDSIYGHWIGFMDQESGIDFYRVCLGTRPYLDDTISFVNVGLTQEIYWRGTFTIGQTYFITVSACNKAGLCSKVSSDGITIDNSPPIAGLVRIGSSSIHEFYQPHNTSVRIHWEGFEDPHSGIQKFEACIGDNPFTCNVIPKFSCLLQSSVIKTNINLPIGRTLYATVFAFNNVGLTEMQTSPSFLVDETPPEVVVHPTFLLDYNANKGIRIQWERTVLRLFWKFKDEDSPIVTHELSLITHHEGHSPVERMHLGNINNITLILDKNNSLHNGDRYYAEVTSCNAARHCSTAFSTNLLIDSTPPFLGGFKPPMTWENILTSDGKIQSNLTLTWYGFEDGESDIDTYYITASKTYTGQELSGGIVPIAAQNNLDESKANITLGTFLNADDTLVLTIWAQNKAGLNSTIGRISVNTLLTSKNINKSSLSGVLEIQKHSCDVHFCNKDCTCAVLGQPCTDVGNIKPCQKPYPLSNISSPAITVSAGVRHYPQTITASSYCLSAFWDTTDRNNTHQIVRYEWSAGLLGQPVGEGVFDLKSEIPWHDVGLHSTFIHCLPSNYTLLHGKKYIIYIRAWFDFDLFSEYHSRPFTVDHSGPAVGRGKFVKDSDSNCNKDFDYITFGNIVTACWDGVFDEQQGEIIHYYVSLGSSKNFDDILLTTNVLLNTSFTVIQANLTHGTKYFFTVTAHNNIGAYTSVVSDGFIIDKDKPTAGVVFNTKFHRNEPFQSLNNSFAISWHGFVDHFSGITSYLVALVEAEDTSLSNATFVSVGLKTTHEFINLNLMSDVDYVGVVKAVDAAGYVSHSVKSPIKKIDITQPIGYSCPKFTNVDEDSEIGFSQGKFNNISLSVNFTKDDLYIFKSYFRSNDSRLNVILAIDSFKIRLPITTSHDGLRLIEYSFFSSFSGLLDVIIRFESSNTIACVNKTALIKRCDKMIPDCFNALQAQQIGPTVVAVNVVAKDEESGIHKVIVGAGSTYGGFQLHPLIQIYGGNNGILYINSSHQSPVYITAVVENYAGLKTVFHSQPFIMDHTPPSIENVTTNLNLAADGSSIIHTFWIVKDPESSLKACYCSIGRSPLAADIVEFWNSASIDSCMSPEVKLEHGSEVFTSIKCVNNVELSQEVSSGPIFIAKHPPTADQAKVSFMKLNRESSDSIKTRSNSKYVQTNDSHIDVQWSGFKDVLPIDYYEYRLLRNNLPLLDWTKTGRKTMVTVNEVPLHSGSTYMFEVKAFNELNASSLVRSSLLIYKEQPKLTGIPVVIIRSGRNLNLDWSKVFDRKLPMGVSMLYNVAIGSRPGFNDIADFQQTEKSSLDIVVPQSTIVSPKVTEAFISITCRLNTGTWSRYQSSYKL